MEQKQTTTITVFSENRPGVLYHIANQFLRRKINIESLTVSEIEEKHVSRFTIAVKENPEIIAKITNQLQRIIEVLSVHAHGDKDLIFKEIALFKVKDKSPKEAQDIQHIAYRTGSNITHRGKNYVIVEKTGTEEEIDHLRSKLVPFGIEDVVRSGRIALEKEPTKKVDSPHVTSTIEVSVIKQIELLAKQNKDVISLAQGTPSFFTSAHIKQAVKRAMDQNLTDKYTAGYGIEPLRAAIAKKVKRDNGIAVSPSQVIVAHGAMEAMMAIFLSILDPQDDILMPSPNYNPHITQIRIALRGRSPIYVPMEETKEGWLLNTESLEKAITPQTRAIVICNPSNPTGKVYSKKELTDIIKIARKHDLIIISDEMYENFVYDGKKHVSIASLHSAGSKIISVFGVSKSYAMTGWRIGYIVASQPLIDRIFKVHDAIVTCPAAPSQYAALSALEGKNVYDEYKKAYVRRRKIVEEELAKTPFLQSTPIQGAYYAFPKITKPVDDRKFAVELIKQAKVAVVPGSPFGPGGENHIRISFGCEDDVLRQGLRRLVNYLNKKFS